MRTIFSPNGKKTIRMNSKDYEQAIAEGRTSHPANFKCNQASEIVIDGETFSRDIYAKENGNKNWRATPGGCIWYYRSENGNDLIVK